MPFDIARSMGSSIHARDRVPRLRPGGSSRRASGSHDQSGRCRAKHHRPRPRMATISTERAMKRSVSRAPAPVPGARQRLPSSYSPSVVCPISPPGSLQEFGANVELDEGQAECLATLQCFAVAFGSRFVGGGGVGIEAHFVAIFAAEQLVAGHAVDFAHEVPRCNFETGDSAAFTSPVAKFFHGTRRSYRHCRGFDRATCS